MREDFSSSDSQHLSLENGMKRLASFFWDKDDTQLSRKTWFALIFAMLIIVDIVIVLDIPIIRSVLAFLYFSTVPGLLLLEVLQLTMIGYAKRFVVGVGLSVVFLMFVGLIFNEIYLAVGIPNPVSLDFMLPSFTLVLALLIFAAYRANRTEGGNVKIPNPRSIVGSSADAPLLMFAMLFPFLAIFGTYLMNTQENNAILIILLLLIFAYVIALVAVARQTKVTEIVYPVAILMISVALLLKHGLTSSYLLGVDVHGEYISYQAVVNNQYWSLPASGNKLIATLTTSILPAVLQLLSGVSGFYIYKLVMQLIFSVTPVAVYFVARKYVNETYAFLASIFFMTQIGFMSQIQGDTREEIAILFLTLAAFVYLEEDIRGSQKTLLFVLFASAIVFANYSAALVFILVLALAWVLAAFAGAYPRLRHHQHEPNSPFRTISFAMILALVALFFLWWSQISASELGLSSYFLSTLHEFQTFFVTENQGTGVTHALGHTAGIVEAIRSYTYDLVFVISGIGVLSIFIKRERKFFRTGYAFFALASALLLVAWLFLPGPGGFSVTRIVQVLLVFLAVPFVIGVCSILKTMRINKQRYFVSVVLLLLLVQFASTTYLLDQAAGVPTSLDLNRSGFQGDALYIYPGEEVAANWLANNMVSNGKVATDKFGGIILSDVGLRPFDPYSYIYFSTNDSYLYRSYLSDTNDSYLYLRYLNVRGEVQVSPVSSQEYGQAILNVPLVNFSQFYSAKNKLYENGESVIYR
jgi:uncharacterized membrane protein